MMKQFLTILFLSAALYKASAQVYPRNYFRHPLDIPMQLVANFGEIRANHWHMGLDIRTQQRVNLPVHAAAEGFVSRVVVEPGGFGQAIYITHPNGYTTLYAHLNAFFPALADYVKKEQYTRRSWRVSLDIPARLFPLAKGDYIGLSGSTGASEGPHVHFEIRDSRTEKCLNPLLFGFPLPDAVPPTISRLALYDRSRSTYAQTPQLLPVRKAGSLYTLAAAPALRVGTRRISFAIGAVDHFSGSANPNGIYSALVTVDGQPVSQFVHDNIGYDDTRYINAQVDLLYKSRGGPTLQHTSPLPGATAVAYNTFGGDGLISLNDEAPHTVEIEVADANNNRSKLRFEVQYDPALARAFAPESGERLLPNNLNYFERPSFELVTTEYSMYDTVTVSYAEEAAAAGNAVSALHRLLGAGIPSHDSVTVRLRPAAALTAEQRERIVIRNVSGSRSFVQRARYTNGWLAARFRQFGTYQAFLDTEPPTVNAPPADLRRATRLVFTPQDNFNTIRSFRAELDGQWLRFSNDKGRSWIYAFDEHFPRGEHQLRLMIEDEAGNVLDRSWTVLR